MSDVKVDEWPFVGPERRPSLLLEPLGWYLGSRPEDWVKLALAGLYHCAPIGWSRDGQILVLRPEPEEEGRAPATQAVAVASPDSGETWLVCEDLRDLLPALVGQWLVRARTVQWDALAELLRARGPAVDDDRVIVREPGLSALRELFGDTVARAALCSDVSDVPDLLRALPGAALRLAAGTLRERFLEEMIAFKAGEPWTKAPERYEFGAWMGPVCRLAVWFSRRRPIETRVEPAMLSARFPACDDNGWAYGRPMVTDAAGARTRHSAVYDAARILAGLPAEARSDPLLAATAAIALGELRSYRGAAHLDASRELSSRQDWDGARVAVLGLAFWLRGPTMRAEARTLGLYMSVLERRGGSLLLAIARRHHALLQAWSRS